MQTEVTMAERAEVDMFCDHCKGEISEGQDYFYDNEVEEILCEGCAEDVGDDNNSYL